MLSTNFFKKIGRRVFSKSVTTESKAVDSSIDPRDLEPIRVVGNGSFGRVYLTRNKKTKEIIAVKRLEKALLVEQRQVQHIKNEKEILQCTNHPFIVTYIDRYSDDYYLYILLEFVPGGDLYSYLQERKKLTVDEARFYAGCIADVFRYLHNMKIIFRDLKPENLLIGADGYLKFTDFGFAKVVTSRTYTLCGTPEYVAPEILLNKGHGESVDWWTLGILIYELIAGFTPFGSADVMLVYERILDGKITFARGFDPKAKSLVRHLLAHDLSRRYGVLANGAADVMNHRFFGELDFDALRKKSLTPRFIPKLKAMYDDSRYEHIEDRPTNPSPLSGKDDPFIDW